MTHPSAVLRGRVLTLPITTRSGACLDGLPAQVVGAIRRVHPRAVIIATVSAELAAETRILTVSGRRQRSVSQWRRLIAPALEASDTAAVWTKALVFVAAQNE